MKIPILPMNSARERALALLSQREHGAFELAQKLTAKGFETKDIQAVLDECAEQGLQSDKRFAENLARYRVQRGYGPNYIRQELHAKHIADDYIHQALQPFEADWLDYAYKAWQKKFKQTLNPTIKDKQAFYRFLAYRGFSSELITQMLGRFLS